MPVFHRIPYHKLHRRAQHNSFGISQLVVDFITNGAFTGEAGRWEAGNGGHALDGAQEKEAANVEQRDGK